MSVKQIAVVKSTDGNSCEVEVNRKDACAGCSQAHVCAYLGFCKKMHATAINKAGAETGDTVYIETQESAVLLLAALVFILPLISAGAGYLIAAAFTAVIWIQSVSAASGFIGAFVFLKIYSSKRPDSGIVVTEIIKRNNM